VDEGERRLYELLTWTVTLKTSVDVIIKAYIICIISEVKWDNGFISFI
jgi:hypothetical protein